MKETYQGRGKGGRLRDRERSRDEWDGEMQERVAEQS